MRSNTNIDCALTWRKPELFFDLNSILNTIPLQEF